MADHGEFAAVDNGCTECSPVPHQGGYGHCECECHDGTSVQPWRSTKSIKHSDRSEGSD